MSAAPSPPQVIAVVATYQRPRDVRRLLDSLSQSTVPLHSVVIVDNGDDGQTAEIVAETSLPAVRLVPESNLGCGGGLAMGEQYILNHYPTATHLWILDDDTVVSPQTLAELISAMDAHGAGISHALVINEHEVIGWQPGLRDRKKLRALNRSPAPDAFYAEHSDAPIPFSWCQGIAMLVRKDLFEKLGLHAGNFWVRGEDLEFSLRMTWHHKGIYVPRALVRHLPPDGVGRGAAEYPKHLAMLQNQAFLSLRLPHGRRTAWTIPANIWRFLRKFGLSCGVCADITRAIFYGAILGIPAGVRRPKPWHRDPKPSDAGAPTIPQAGT